MKSKKSLPNHFVLLLGNMTTLITDIVVFDHHQKKEDCNKIDNVEVQTTQDAYSSTIVAPTPTKKENISDAKFIHEVNGAKYSRSKRCKKQKCSPRYEQDQQ